MQIFAKTYPIDWLDKILWIHICWNFFKKLINISSPLEFIYICKIFEKNYLIDWFGKKLWIFGVTVIYEFFVGHCSSNLHVYTNAPLKISFRRKTTNAHDNGIKMFPLCRVFINISSSYETQNKSQNNKLVTNQKRKIWKMV